MDEAVYFFTTVHKSKGLEWPTVVLLNDFFDLPEGLLTPKDLAGALNKSDVDDEKNILYVAMTRATRTLALNNVMFNLLATSQDFRERVTRRKDLNVSDSLSKDKDKTDATPALSCQFCASSDFEAGNLRIELKRLNLPGAVKRNRSQLCSYCSSIRRQFLSSTKKFVPNQNRAFLRYVTGVGEDKIEAAKVKLQQKAHEPYIRFNDKLIDDEAEIVIGHIEGFGIDSQSIAEEFNQPFGNENNLENDASIVEEFDQDFSPEVAENENRVPEPVQEVEVSTIMDEFDQPFEPKQGKTVAAQEDNQDNFADIAPDAFDDDF